MLIRFHASTRQWVIIDGKRRYYTSTLKITVPITGVIGDTNAWFECEGTWNGKDLIS